MTETLSVDIPIILPGIPDVNDACVERLMSRIQARPGVEHVHVTSGRSGEPSQLCVHYDPEVITLARIREFVVGTGAEISDRFGHLLRRVEGVRHSRRARTISQSLRDLQGVVESEVTVNGVLRVEFDRTRVTERDLFDKLASMGVTPVRKDAARGASKSVDASDANEPISKDVAEHDHPKHEGAAGDHEHSHGALLGPNTELIFSLACGALLAIGFALEKLVPAAPGWLPTTLYLVAGVFGGFYTLREAFENLRERRFEIDTLMLVAAAGAAALGAFAEGALLLFLFSLGHALEHYAMGRAKQAIEALAQLAPPTATVLRDGQSREIHVEELLVGDLVLVRPNERLPADGFVAKGETSINQAPVTGESIPVDKRPVEDAGSARQRPDQVDASSRVYAGTINGAGAIEIEVTRLSHETALAKVVQMVSEAETQKSPTQRFTDRFERIFVPVVLALAALLLAAGLVIDEPFSATFYRAMAVLVAASPCALAIATPSAVLSGVARAARGGVLVKGGGPLENLGSLKAIAFDKTGTLTEGRPHITDVVAVDGTSTDELLTVAVAVERLSDHPLAAAIVRDGRLRLGQREVPEALGLTALTGRGVTAQLAGVSVAIGKAEMFGIDEIAPLGAAALAAIASLREAGRTTMVVRYGDRDLGVIGLMDTPRAAARGALAELRALGIKRLIMISGDHQKVAEAIAGEVGIDEAWGDLMPADKVAAIKKLSVEQKVAMVGDGVNDAPAMANSTVGIAMGAAGSDVALETADVALMADDLSHLPFAVGLSRQTRSIILQNVVVSLGVVAVLVPSTIFGLSIGAAVAMHEGSTLLVVVNALRLLAYRDTKRNVQSDSEYGSGPDA